MYKDTGLIFAGELFMAKSTNGVPGALNGPINVPSLQITPPTTEVRNRPSFQPENYGQALDVVNVPADPTQVTLQFDSLPADAPSKLDPSWQEHGCASPPSPSSPPSRCHAR